MNLPISKPKFKLKLIHSGLTLVSVPLIFGWIMTVALNSALQQSLHMRKNIERSAIASNAINKLVRDCIEFRTDITDQNVENRNAIAQEAKTAAKNASGRTDTKRLDDDISAVQDDLKILLRHAAENGVEVRDFIVTVDWI